MSWIKGTDMTIDEADKFRREAALAFTIAACDKVGMVSDDDIRIAILQADALTKALGG